VRVDPQRRLELLVKEVGRNIRTARHAAGITQEEASASAGISYRSFAELERGRGRPALMTLVAVAEVLDVSVADLVAVPEKKPRVPLAERPLNPPKRGRKRVLRRFPKKQAKG
jgi:transcriptional regulator with XRE-family HTH domain